LGVISSTIASSNHLKVEKKKPLSNIHFTIGQTENVRHGQANKCFTFTLEFCNSESSLVTKDACVPV
jgi:hypothetical protein